MHDFIYNLRFLQMNSYDGDGRKNPEIYTETKEKSPVWLPSHPPVYKLEADCFPGREEPKTSRTYPRWGRDPNLQR